MGDSAQMSWSDHRSVFLQSATQRRRCHRTPLGLPCCQFLVRQRYVHAASRSINANRITVLDERQRATHSGFRASEGRGGRMPGMARGVRPCLCPPIPTFPR